MSQKLYDLPLKVLWIYNCNETEIAVNFQLKEAGKSYQVKGTGVNAFNEKAELRVCLTDNIESIYFLNPNKKVFISRGDLLKKIWNYWKTESGEIRYNSIIANLERQKEGQAQSLFENNQLKETQAKDQEEKKQLFKPENIVLNKKQILDLTFEIEAIYGMLKAFQGEVKNDQVLALVENSIKGFSEESRKEVYSELIRREIILED